MGTSCFFRKGSRHKELNGNSKVIDWKDRPTKNFGVTLRLQKLVGFVEKASILYASLDSFQTLHLCFVTIAFVHGFHYNKPKHDQCASAG